MLLLGFLLSYVVLGSDLCFDMDQWRLTGVKYSDTSCPVGAWQKGIGFIGGAAKIHGGLDHWECMDLKKLDKNKDVYVYVNRHCTDALWADYLTVDGQSFGTMNNQWGFCMSADRNDGMGLWKGKVGLGGKCFQALKLRALNKGGKRVTGIPTWNDLLVEISECESAKGPREHDNTLHLAWTDKVCQEKCGPRSRCDRKCHVRCTKSCLCNKAETEVQQEVGQLFSSKPPPGRWRGRQELSPEVQQEVGLSVGGKDPMRELEDWVNKQEFSQEIQQERMSYAMSGSWEGITFSQVVTRSFALIGAITVVYYVFSLLYRQWEAKDYTSIEKASAEI